MGLETVLVRALMMFGAVVVVAFFVLYVYGLIMQVYDVMRSRRRHPPR